MPSIFKQKPKQSWKLVLDVDIDRLPPEDVIDALRQRKDEVNRASPGAIDQFESYLTDMTDATLAGDETAYLSDLENMRSWLLGLSIWLGSKPTT